MKKKLTIKSWITERPSSEKKLTKHKSEQHKHFDPPPICLFQSVDVERETVQQKPANCRVLWCYYFNGKRVATVLIDKGDGTITWPEVNRLRRCWPTSISIRFSDIHRQKHASSWESTGTATLYDTQANRYWRLNLEPVFSDEAFVHPEDDEDFDKSTNLTQADRNWIDAQDREQAYKFETTLSKSKHSKGSGPPFASKKVRNWSQAEAYSLKTVRTFAKLWCAHRDSMNSLPRLRDFLECHREELAELNIRTIDDLKRIREVARKSNLIGRWKKFPAKKSEK